MAVEGRQGGPQPPRPGGVVHEPQPPLVTEVHAVEGADRNGASLRAACGRADLARIAPDDHGDPCGASTTVGFTPPPRRSYTASSSCWSSTTANGPGSVASPSSA